MSDVHGHIPVLMEEILDLLAPSPGDVYVDCTAGRGGHAAEMAGRVSPGGSVMLLDRDSGNLAYASDRVSEAAGETVEVAACHLSFVQVEQAMSGAGWSGDVVLADLGFASTQMDDPARGLSFSADGPLDMRFDPSSGPTAADLLATMSAGELADVIYHYGEDPFARRIAQKLVESRASEPITQSGRLAELVREAYGARARQSRMHPATRTFMALRIAVNDELTALKALLETIERGVRLSSSATEGSGSGQWLRPGARIGIISFHSLEDRMVKQSFAALAKAGLVERLTRKPVRPSDEECSVNPRSRSAKLRVVRIAT